jgi:tripartite motif-containing protein 71
MARSAPRVRGRRTPVVELRKLVRIAIPILLAATSLPLLARSPALAAVSPPSFIRQWGSAGIGERQFNSPTGVAVDGLGDVYVSDPGGDRIEKFSASGTFLTTWGSSGSGNGELHYPEGIAIGDSGDDSGNVYVADAENYRIEEFTSSGDWVRTWGSFGTGDGQFENPNGVAVDGSGDVYVADYGTHRIQEFTSSGGWLRTWGSSGSGNGQFAHPYGVAVDGSGDVYVSDTGNNRIQEFTSSGGWLRTWGSSGSGNGQFSSPLGVAVDGSGHVYVADSGNRRVQEFDASDPNSVMFVTKWGSVGIDPGKFGGPIGIAVAALGDVYVVDQGMARIEEFTSSGDFHRLWGRSAGTVDARLSVDVGVSVHG